MDATNDPPTLPESRSYQLEMFRESLTRNTIISMGTGTGKTHVAILRMKHEAEHEPKKISWYLAPTVYLCKQQYENIRKAVPCNMVLIDGSKYPERWASSEVWQSVKSSYRAVVSTPQVLLDALGHSFIKLGEDIGLLVFDEAHNATGNHPYSLIMNVHYRELRERKGTYPSLPGERPWVLGLSATASEETEKALYSVIVAPKDTREDHATFDCRPEVEYLDFQKVDPPQDNSPSNISSQESLSREYQTQEPSNINILRKFVESKKNIIQDQDAKNEFVKNRLYEFYKLAQSIYESIGPWAADWYISKVFEKLKGSGNNFNPYCRVREEDKDHLVKTMQSLPFVDISYDPESIEKGLSKKTSCLIDCLLKHHEKWRSQDDFFSGMIFVKERTTAVILTEVLKNHPKTRRFFTAGTVIGQNGGSRKGKILNMSSEFLIEEGAKVLQDFNESTKNLIVTTAVCEEGIDIQACCCVIRWDPPDNYISYRQSKGRARRKGSNLIMMVRTSDKDETEKKVTKWEEEERRNNSRLLAYREAPEDYKDQSLKYVVPTTGATLDLRAAITNLDAFCKTLPAFSSSEDVRPIYEISQEDQAESATLYRATLILPRLLPPNLRTFSTKQSYPSKKSARRHVAFKAFIALHHSDLLNDNLLPVGDQFKPTESQEVQALLKDVEKCEGIASVRKLMNPWCPTGKDIGYQDDGVWFTNNLEVESIGSYTLYTRQKLPCISPEEGKIYDSGSLPRSFSVSPGEQVPLSSTDLKEAREFTRRLLSVFYGTRMKWDDTNYAYLISPPSDTSVDKVWTMRRSWVEDLALQTTPANARDWVTATASDFGVRFVYPSDISYIISGNNILKFDKWIHKQLPEKKEEEFLKKCKHLGEEGVQYPLLQVHSSQLRLNYLLPRKEGLAENSKIKVVHPKLVKVALDEERNLKLSLFLPSILSAIGIRTIASRIPERFLSKISDIQLLQEALTSRAANAPYSYERLEVLGDTTLKFVTSIHLLAAHPTWPEGYLTKRKDHSVSNAYLAATSIKNGLYRYIVRCPFSVRKWKPDYWESLEVPCSDTNGVLEKSAKTDADRDKGKEVKEVDTRNSSENLSTKTLADVVESLIGTSFRVGSYDNAIACAEALSIDIGCSWRTLSENITIIRSKTASLSRSEIPQSLKDAEQFLGYTFENKAFLIQALMHSSSQAVLHCVSYERMEFLGDALLDSIVVKELYESPRNFPPREIHLRKSALVNTHFLAISALLPFVADTKTPEVLVDGQVKIEFEPPNPLRLATCLMHSSIFLSNELVKVIERYESRHDEIEKLLFTGSRYPWAELSRLQSPKFLSDIIESIIGAVYLDSNGSIEKVKNVLGRLGIMRLLDRMVSADVEILHPVSRLMEWASKHGYRDKIRLEVKKGKDDTFTHWVVTCTLWMEDEEILSISEPYMSKASGEEVRLRVAEDAYEILMRKYSN